MLSRTPRKDVLLEEETAYGESEHCKTFHARCNEKHITVIEFLHAEVERGAERGAEIKR